MHNTHRILVSALGLSILEPVHIALGVAKTQRIDRHFGQRDRGVAGIIEEHRETVLTADRHVVIAMGADIEFQF